MIISQKAALEMPCSQLERADRHHGLLSTCMSHRTVRWGRLRSVLAPSVRPSVLKLRAKVGGSCLGRCLGTVGRCAFAEDNRERGITWPATLVLPACPPVSPVSPASLPQRTRETPGKKRERMQHRHLLKHPPHSSIAIAASGSSLTTAACGSVSWASFASSWDCSRS